MQLPSSPRSIKSSVAAAVQLMAIQLAQQAGCPVPTDVAAVLACTGAGRSQAYEMLARLSVHLDSLQLPAGRPCAASARPDVATTVACQVRDFLMLHPGAATMRGARHHYTDSFRRFVVGLFAPGSAAHTLTLEQAADTVGVPAGTLKDWLAPTASSILQTPEATPPNDAPDTTHEDIAQPQIATLLLEYSRWEGDLSSFCEYARAQLGLPFGRSFITHVLTAAGVYRPSGRSTPHQAPWSHGAMHSSFPGMQWFGDGKQLRVHFQDSSFLFNLEAMVDGASNAVVAARVSDAEDGPAVIDAFHQGLHTTEGQLPMSVTLDNRPANFAPEVEHALADTQLLHATPRRGQAKAPVEGAFGLFEQALPAAISVQEDTAHDVAQRIAQLVSYAFFVGRNGRRRARLGGQTPAEAYMNANPTPEQIQDAKLWILELRRREELARQSRERRTDPVRLQLLQEQLQLLGIPDPSGCVALSLCGYSMDAIVEGIAIYKAKKLKGTIPTDCQQERYLGGIIRNTDTRSMIELQASYLLELRIRAGDLHLAPLRRIADHILASLSPEQATCKLVDLALDANAAIGFRFFASVAAAAIAGMVSALAVPLYHHLVRVIAAAFKADRRSRELLVAQLAKAVSPVAV